MFKLFLSVFIGGGLGSVSRYGLALLAKKYIPVSIPFSTLCVNILGSFLIGLFLSSSLIEDKPQWSHFLSIGFCGGFTTFSAFSWENLMLLKQGDILLMVFYVITTLLFCMLSVWGGYIVGKMI